MHPSGLVAIIDELEERGLVKRQNSLEDRRTYELHLTDKGQAALRDIGRVGQEHNESLCAALSQREREQLTGFLQRIAMSKALLRRSSRLQRIGPPSEKIRLTG